MSEQQTRQRFYLHVCALDGQCRRYAGWTWRLHINTRWGHFGLALWPGDRFVDRYIDRNPSRPRWTSFRKY